MTLDEEEKVKTCAGLASAVADSGGVAVMVLGNLISI